MFGLILLICMFCSNMTFPWWMWLLVVLSMLNED